MSDERIEKANELAEQIKELEKITFPFKEEDRNHNLSMWHFVLSVARKGKSIIINNTLRTPPTESTETFRIYDIKLREKIIELLEEEIQEKKKELENIIG